MTPFGSFLSLAAALLLLSCTSNAFVPSSRSFGVPRTVAPKRSITTLHMSLDLVTYLRTEWISAALCTNQTPRSADVCLQLGCEDGRAINCVPRTIRQLVTSSLEPDGQMTVGVKRQLTQMQQRRKAAQVKFVDQRADDLTGTEDESVDVVISLQAAAPMMKNGLDWKQSVREAARVLKPGGRLLFVEQTDLKGESYLNYVDNLYTMSGDEDVPDDKKELFPVFEEVGYDDVDLVLLPHVAGVAIKSEDAGLTAQQRAQKEADEEKAKIADLSIAAYERGIKKRKRKRKKKGVATEEDTTAST